MRTDQTSRQTPALPLIDALRGGAALAVLFYHVGTLSFFPEDNTAYFEGNALGFLKELGWLKGSLFGLLGFGYLGVPLFFVLSGFCIHLPYVQQGKYESRGGFRDFFKRRFWRIYPPYIAVTCFAFILAGPVLQQHDRYNINIDYLIDHLWFWYYSDNAPGDVGIVGVSWTIALEVFFYIIYAAVGRKLICRFGAARVATAWFASHLLYTLFAYSPQFGNLIPEHNFFSPSRFAITRFGEWMLGAWVAEWYLTKREGSSTRPATWMALALILLGAIPLLGFFFEIPKALASDLLAAAGFTCLIRGGIEIPLKRNHLLWRSLGLAGTISYSLYLFHTPLLSARKFIAQPDPNSNILYNAGWFAGASICCLLVAVLAYHLIEKPSHDLGRNGFATIGPKKFHFRFTLRSAFLLLVLTIFSTGWLSAMLNRRLIAFSSPRDTSFYQIPANGTKSVLVEGRAGFLVDDIEWYAKRIDSASRPPERWRRFASPNWFSGSFSGHINLGPGQHVLWLRTSSPGKSWMSEPKELFVGDVIVVLGQSNALGLSTYPDSSSNNGSRLLNRTDKGSRKLNDPQSPAGGGSPWPECGKLLEQTLGYPVGFVNLAQGGTSIRDLSHVYWLNRNLNRTNWGGERIRAVAWCHGESDSSMDTSEYYQSLTNIIDHSQDGNLFSGEPEWVISLTSWNGSQVAENIRNAQKQVVAKHPAANAGPDSDLISPAQREMDKVHFSSKGNSILAKQWAAAISKALTKSSSNADTESSSPE